MQLFSILTMLPYPCHQPHNSSSCLLVHPLSPCSDGSPVSPIWLLVLRDSSSRVLCWVGPTPFFPSILPVCHPVLTLTCPFTAPPLSTPDSGKKTSLECSTRTSACLSWELQQQKAACYESWELAGLQRSLLRRGSSSGETFGAVLSASPAANHGLIFLLCHLTPLLQRLMHLSPWTPSSLEDGSSGGTFGRFIALAVRKTIVVLGI